MTNNLFIIGCGHSGTTILNKIISNHKNVHGINYETSLFFKNNTEIIKILNDFDSERIKFNKKYVCEKTPSHVYKINQMYEYTINPKIIAITRDGRDVIASLKKRYGDFNKSLNRWINDNNQVLNSSYINNFHILKYEELVSNKTQTLLHICNFLEIEYYDEIFNYTKNKVKLPSTLFDNIIDGDDHNKLRNYQINQDIYDGTGRWKNELTKEEIQQLYSNDKFTEVMVKLGYVI